jgi:hypothetical protein
MRIAIVAIFGGAILGACGGQTTGDPPLTTIDPGTYAASDAGEDANACVIPASFLPVDGGQARGSCVATTTVSLTGDCVGEGRIYAVECTGDGTPDSSFDCTLFSAPAAAAKFYCCPCGQ